MTHAAQTGVSGTGATGMIRAARSVTGVISGRTGMEQGAGMAMTDQSGIEVKGRGAVTGMAGAAAGAKKGAAGSEPGGGRFA